MAPKEPLRCGPRMGETAYNVPKPKNWAVWGDQSSSQRPDTVSITPTLYGELKQSPHHKAGARQARTNTDRRRQIGAGTDGRKPTHRSRQAGGDGRRRREKDRRRLPETTGGGRELRRRVRETEGWRGRDGRSDGGTDMRGESEIGR